MLIALRRLLLLAFIGGVAYALWTTWQRKHELDASDESPAEWPPIPEPAPASAWREPGDGGCPEGFPVKVNAKSGIFHVPGGRSYDRTVPDRCYATAADAEADGYRAAKA